ncbi:TetR/AcrR family transcriptional regulator C-terminal domain-containing protein [Staphylococcus debuckii]|uniref:TetR/AcrR family transcriptional regulator C-terminal domain-containing protein n=1 Tax=Staphylococcus debuckii TaxID=2044912 RepID=UPI000F4382BC|nr:TetR/AcrR family transcriptional regulator C-terminal domain-containing protein [Staphylococcus debuckii]AYU54807.1 TetR family transcriptional regulator [Staphylococcus debuckii]
MKEEDLRVIKTKNNIESAFLTLFYQKEIDKISVKEITSTAQIARKTFYLHYIDKYDLLEKIFIKRLEELREICHTFKIVNLNLIVDEWLKFFYQNQKFYRTLFGDYHFKKSRQQLIQFFKEVLTEVVSEEICRQKALDYHMTLSFLGHGIIGMVDEYIENNEKNKDAIRKHIMTLLNAYRI